MTRFLVIDLLLDDYVVFDSFRTAKVLFIIPPPVQRKVWGSEGAGLEVYIGSSKMSLGEKNRGSLFCGKVESGHTTGFNESEETNKGGNR